MTPGEIIRVTLAYIHPYGSIPNNVFTFAAGNEKPDESYFLDILQWVVEEFAPEWAGIAATAVQLYAMFVDVINADGTVDRDLGGALVEEDGTQGGDPTEPGSTFNLTAYTDRPKTRGRKFFTGLSDSNISSGQLDINVLAALADIAVKYITTYAGDENALLVPGVLSNVDQVFYPFNGNVLFGDVPRSQRRRQPDVGS
jgi:hypothetical protein